MSNFLKKMAAGSVTRAASVKRKFVDSDLDKPVIALRHSGFGVIAEIKNRSPAEGDLGGGNGNRIERALAYARGGAAAISVLTEPTRFDGALAHLQEVVAAVPQTPVMRKDFLVQPVQVLEAKAAGASGVLLIAAMLDKRQICSMLDCAFEHGMFVLMESFSETDLVRALKVVDRSAYSSDIEANRLLLGINTRDLRTLEVDPDRLEKFAPLLPRGITKVAESGQKVPADARAAAGWGYDMTLVGTALMQSDDPAALIRDMLAAGRGA